MSISDPCANIHDKVIEVIQVIHSSPYSIKEDKHEAAAGQEALQPLIAEMVTQAKDICTVCLGFYFYDYPDIPFIPNQQKTSYIGKISYQFQRKGVIEHDKRRFK